MLRDKLITELEIRQKQCQRGISGHGPVLYENVNEFCADLYGLLGLAITELKGIKHINPRKNK